MCTNYARAEILFRLLQFRHGWDVINIRWNVLPLHSRTMIDNMRGSRKFSLMGSKSNVFFVLRGKRVQIPLKACHFRPASETPFKNGVSLACRWWPNIECWLGSFETFENFRGSGPVLLRNPISLWFFRGRVRIPCPPLDPRMDNAPSMIIFSA